MSRRQFIKQASALGIASLAGFSNPSRAEPPPEVTKLRLVDFPAICIAPGYLAEELLHAEGFEEIEYVPLAVNSVSPDLLSGRVDIWMDAAPSLVNVLSTNDGVVALGGLHAGCYELIAKHDIRTIRDLKGRSVSISMFGAPSIFSSPAWWPMWGSIRAGISTGG